MARMDEIALYDLLMKCLPSQLDAVTVKLQLKEAFLPGAGEPVATRSQAILKLVKQSKGLAALEKALNEVLGRESKPKARTTGESRRVTRPAAQRTRPVSPHLAPPPVGQPTGATTGAVSHRTIRIFLASSEELREDRDAFDLYFRQLNDQLRKDGVYLEITRWENFLDAMSETRLQDEYNKAVRDCDIFVSLFFTKTGKFTEEEFDTAHRQFLKTRRPLIYTFFKDAEIRTGSARAQDLNSLWAFQEKLKNLKHFYTKYTSIDHLKLQFRDQLLKLLQQGATVSNTGE